MRLSLRRDSPSFADIFPNNSAPTLPQRWFSRETNRHGRGFKAIGFVKQTLIRLLWRLRGKQRANLGDHREHPRTGILGRGSVKDDRKARTARTVTLLTSRKNEVNNNQKDGRSFGSKIGKEFRVHGSAFGVGKHYRVPDPGQPHV